MAQQQKTFGRKNAAPPPVRVARAPASAPAPSPVMETATALDVPAVSHDPLNAELAEWKAQRSKGLAGIPWHQLSLMASLCFGIASFVLPALVNSWVDYLLYLLSVASLIAWFNGRKAKKA